MGKAIAFLGMDQVARMLALPKGLRALAVRDDFQRDGVAVLVEGESLAAHDPCMELPRLPVTMLDRTELAMQAEVRGWDRDDGANVEVWCPVGDGCSWSHEWQHGMPSLGAAADVVQRHLAEVHSG